MRANPEKQCRLLLERSPLTRETTGKNGRVTVWRAPGYPYRFSRATVERLLATGEAIRNGDTITKGPNYAHP